MTSVSVAQPDVTLLLDLDGVITRATLSSAVGEERVDAWIGRPWAETVGGGGGVRHLVDDARRTGVSAFRLVTQRFPSGLELPIEYTTVRLGGEAGLLAVGRSLQAVDRVRSRLVSSQRSLERDSWKLRQVETRYRLLFDTADQAVLVVQADDLRVLEANPAAIRAIGADPVGRDALDGLAPADRGPLRAMLARVREHGKAPGLLVRLGGDAKRRWQVKALRMTQEPDAVLLLQFAPAASPAVGAPGDAVPVEALIEGGPDGFVVVGAGGGTVVHANRSFLELVQAPAKATVLGQPLGRWLGRPGADLNALLDNVQRHGHVRRFSTVLLAELGSETEVEVSAFGDAAVRPRLVGLLIRDVGGRPLADDNGARAAGALGAALGALDRQVGKTPLLQLVKTTVGEVERHFVTAALDMTRGNRTAAAELLGLSRQSLYAKLWRYGLDSGGEAASD